jgi:hypothetical protein
MLDAVTSARAGFGFAGVHQGKCLIGTVGRAACERGMAFTAAGRIRDTASRGAEHVALMKWLWGNPPTLM